MWVHVVYQVYPILKPVFLVMFPKIFICSRNKKMLSSLCPAIPMEFTLPTHCKIPVGLMSYNFLIR